MFCIVNLLYLYSIIYNKQFFFIDLSTTPLYHHLLRAAFTPISSTFTVFSPLPDYNFTCLILRASSLHAAGHWPCRRSDGAPPDSELVSSEPPGSLNTSHSAQLSSRSLGCILDLWSRFRTTWWSWCGPLRLQGGTCTTGQRPLSGTCSAAGLLWSPLRPQEQDAPWTGGRSRWHLQKSRLARSDAALLSSGR